LQQHPGGARRPEQTARSARRPATVATRINRRSIGAARALRTRLGTMAVPTGSVRSSLAAGIRSIATAERALPVAVAAIVAVASMLTLLPNTPQGAVGGTQGRGSDLRIAVNGGMGWVAPADTDPSLSDLALAGPALAGGVGTVDTVDGGDPSFQPVRIPDDIVRQPGTEQSTAEPGPFLDDGTLLTGYAPATDVEDGSDLVQTYRVKSGDTLVTVARKFGVKMMTLWWANDLKSKDALHVGQILRIPTVNGLVVTVKESDTLASLAAQYGLTESEIIDLNNLADPTLVVGQVLVLPGAHGAPVPTPKPTPTPKPVYHPRAASSGSHSTRSSGPVHYSGGSMHWPVVGGNNYVSQYFHYGHWAIDIAADYGSRVVAAAGGTVTFAGWKSNGGGWQVWISHGSGLYTTYNHMSAISVGDGQSVGRGQQVGRVGQSGHATGPHLHFEVWQGPIWNGGTRVNPLRYL
jgi:murein DD-endopeptidase MepM/ murein hydrolase activator NlpD